MALVHDGTMNADDDMGNQDTDSEITGNSGSTGNSGGTGGTGSTGGTGNRDSGKPTKKVFLVAAFIDDRATGDRSARPAGPVSGMAEHVVAVIGMDGDRQRFEWVGDGQRDSVANPALVTPIRVGVGLPSPWHPDADHVVTGLVPLAADQLGTGPVDDDLDHLLAELGRSRDVGPARQGGVGYS